MMLLRLGDLALTASLALAVGALLFGLRDARAALRWLLVFAAGIGLVGASKIAYLGWGCGLPALGFKALSGHATGTMAVYPPLAYLLAGRRWRGPAACAGAVLGLAVTALLVVMEEHGLAEALAGATLGTAIAVAGIRLAGPRPRTLPAPAVACLLVLLSGSVLLLASAPVGYWMIQSARLLSGHAHLYPLSIRQCT